MQVTLRVDSFVTDYIKERIIGSHVMLNKLHDGIINVLQDNNFNPYYVSVTARYILKQNGILENEISFFLNHYSYIKKCFVIHDIIDVSVITIDDDYITSIGRMKEIDWDNLVERLQALEPRVKEITDKYLGETKTEKPETPSRTEQIKKWFNEPI